MKTFKVFLTEATASITPEIQRIVAAGRYRHYGLRADAYAPKVGDAAAPSHDWTADNPQPINGTSALAIHGNELKGAWPIDYSGTHLVLLGSDHITPGTDRNEVVMIDAVVLGVWPMGAGFY